jgi:hypothetical protein
MKPLGVNFGLNGRGQVALNVRKPSRTEDAVWNAVEEAHMEGWTPEQFLSEVRSAWDESRTRALKDELGRLK